MIIPYVTHLPAKCSTCESSTSYRSSSWSCAISLQKQTHSKTDKTPTTTELKLIPLVVSSSANQWGLQVNPPSALHPAVFWYILALASSVFTVAECLVCNSNNHLQTLQTCYRFSWLEKPVNDSGVFWCDRLSQFLSDMTMWYTVRNVSVWFYHSTETSF